MLHSTFFLALGLVDFYQPNASDLLLQGKAWLALRLPKSVARVFMPGETRMRH